MSFSDDLGRARAKVEAKMTKIVRNSAVKAGERIIALSPVDTGRFRGNWQASVDFPKLNTLFDSIPIGQKISSIEDVKANTTGYTLNGAIYLTNNLPYAERLEDGWSGQRRAGWVSTTVQIAKEQIQAEFDKL